MAHNCSSGPDDWSRPLFIISKQNQSFFNNKKGYYCIRGLLIYRGNGLTCLCWKFSHLRRYWVNPIKRATKEALQQKVANYYNYYSRQMTFFVFLGSPTPSINHFYNHILANPSFLRTRGFPNVENRSSENTSSFYTNSETVTAKLRGKYAIKL